MLCCFGIISSKSIAKLCLIFTNPSHSEIVYFFLPEENLPVIYILCFFKLPPYSSCILVGKFLNYCRKGYIEGSFLRLGTRTTDAQSSLFSSKSQTFGLGQTICAYSVRPKQLFWFWSDTDTKTQIG